MTVGKKGTSMLRKWLTTGFLTAALSGAALAQQPFNGVGTVSRTVSNASASVQLASGTSPSAMVCNTGTNTAYVKFGDSTVAAATTDTPVVAGACAALSPNGQGYIAAITASSTTSLLIASGSGNPTGFGGGSSSITNWAGDVLGTMANYGTSPGAVLVPGVNAFVTNANTNGQATMANSSPVTMASNQAANPLWGQGATAAGVPPNAVYFGVNLGGSLTGLSVGSAGTPSGMVITAQSPSGDPCQAQTKSYQTISQTANTQLFAGTSAKKTYVCSIIVAGADAENVSLVSGTGSVCATATAAMIGGTTAAAGLNLSANGGFSIGNGGYAMAVSAVNADNVCLFQSGSGRVAGVMTYVAQ